ncbi:hypothetical protein GCM10009096_30130 [Parasphingorhabdus litoris]|uniref:Uncharacterized protein n=1 Tax=Parasphingorhabdus litoris TaxID=394733 RepID=A0ABN1AXA1_9SPHN
MLPSSLFRSNSRFAETISEVMRRVAAIIIVNVNPGILVYFRKKARFATAADTNSKTNDRLELRNGSMIATMMKTLNAS